MPKTSEVDALCNSVGEFIEYWGFKRIHGRIWTLMVVHEGPIDANYLIDRLHVSKALVSLSLKDLVEFDVIHELPKLGRECQKYEVNPDIPEVILSILRRREHRILGRIDDAQRIVETLPADKLNAEQISVEKLKFLGNMIREARTILDTLISLQLIPMENWKLDQSHCCPLRNGSSDHSAVAGESK